MMEKRAEQVHSATATPKAMQLHVLQDQSQGNEIRSRMLHMGCVV